MTVAADTKVRPPTEDCRFAGGRCSVSAAAQPRTGIFRTAEAATESVYETYRDETHRSPLREQRDRRCGGRIAGPCAHAQGYGNEFPKSSRPATMWMHNGTPRLLFTHVRFPALFLSIACLEFMRAKSKTAQAVLPKPGKIAGHASRRCFRTRCGSASKESVKFPGSRANVITSRGS